MRDLFNAMAWLRGLGLSTEAISEIWGLILTTWTADTMEARISDCVHLAQAIAKRVPGSLDDRLLAALAGLTDGDDFQNFVRQVKDAKASHPELMVSTTWMGEVGTQTPAEQLADLLVM